MGKFYGILGAHRTGKTTLATELAKTLKVPFCRTSVSTMLASLGLDPQADLPFADRLQVQNLVLRWLLQGYSRALEQLPDTAVILVDRTPLDVLAYTTSEIQRQTMTPELSAQMDLHRQRCIEAMNFNFMGATLVSPGIPLIADAKSATANIHYQRNVHGAMVVAALDLDLKMPISFLPQETLDLKARVSHTAEHVRAIIHASITQELTDVVGGTSSIH